MGYNNSVKCYNKNQGTVMGQKVTVVQLHMWVELERDLHEIKG